jgi:HPt (histidine-containing phosphotransfer) domain-containing protein
MAYDPGTMDIALSAAVGPDADLLAELRLAFLESAERQVDLLARARCDANWLMAGLRLKGLCASFGAQDLAALADEAIDSAPGDPAIQRRIAAVLAGYRKQS